MAALTGTVILPKFPQANILCYIYDMSRLSTKEIKGMLNPLTACLTQNSLLTPPGVYEHPNFLVSDQR